MSNPTPAELLDLIADRAPALRRAGVTELELDGFSIKLAPHEPEQIQHEATESEQSPARPQSLLDDPESYGLPPGSQVPGFAALRDLRREKGKTS